MHSNLNRAPDAKSAWVWLPFYVLPHITRVLLCLAQVSFISEVLLSFSPSSFSFKHGPGAGNSEGPFDTLIACGFFLYFVITASPPSMRLLLSLDSCSFCGLLLNCEEGGCGWERASCDLSGAPSAAEVGLKEIKFSYAVQCAISSSSTFYAFHLRSILFLHYHPFFSSNRR